MTGSGSAFTKGWANTARSFNNGCSWGAHALFAGCTSSATSGSGSRAFAAFCLLSMEGTAAPRAATESERLSVADADADAPAEEDATGVFLVEDVAASADIARATASSSSSVMGTA